MSVSRERTRRAGALARWIVLVGPFVGLALFVWTAWLSGFLRVLTWFDGLLLYYNFLMVVAAMLTPLAIAALYSSRMRPEKERRIRNDLSSAAWQRNRDYIRERLSQEFRFRNYVGSVGASMLVTGFGAVMLLLMKPVAPLAAGDGVRFELGANFLVLGPYMVDVGHYDAIWPFIVFNLTAFVFGFLGAWVYFLQDLTRHYFTCDLTPNTFVIGTVRMITASLLALVIGYVVPGLLGMGATGAEPGTAGYKSIVGVLAVIGFFFGFFPSRALLVIENVAARALHTVLNRSDASRVSTGLSSLPGISYQHELRLEQEGIDNVENLSHADPLELAIRTRFGSRQLRHWIGEAWLRVHLGRDWESFVTATGITGREELCDYLRSAGGDGAAPDAPAALGAGLDPRLQAKIRVISALACASEDRDIAEAADRAAASGEATPGRRLTPAGTAARSAPV